MAYKYHKEKQKNIDALIVIRDDIDTPPVVKVQSIRTLQKLLDAEHPQTELNFKTLTAIRDDESIKASIRVMAMQTLNSMFETYSSSDVDDTTPTEESIMGKIRGGKK